MTFIGFYPYLYQTNRKASKLSESDCIAQHRKIACRDQNRTNVYNQQIQAGSTKQKQAFQVVMTRPFWKHKTISLHNISRQAQKGNKLYVHEY